MEFLAEVVRVVTSDDAAKPWILWHANPTLTHAGGRLHYIEITHAANQRTYSLSAVEATEVIVATIAHLGDGTTLETLRRLPEFVDFTTEEVNEFLNEIIETQLVVPNIELCVTGVDATTMLTRDLAPIDSWHDRRQSLLAAQARLYEIDREGVGCRSELYDRAIESLSEISSHPVDPSRSIQVDLFKPASNLSLTAAVVDELVVGAELLRSTTNHLDRLSEFAHQFEERYGTQQVPLLEVLDEEIGIGLPEPETNDRLMRQLAERDLRRDALLADLRVRAVQANSLEVELSDSDIERLRVPGSKPLPDAFSILATIDAESSVAIDAGDYRLVLQFFSGPSGARMLGRFADLSSELESALREHVQAEEALRPGDLFAEIVHLPQGRVGNIASRPVLRRYEIAYLGRGGVDAEWQISPSDLEVCVREGTIILRSVRLGRIVHPRLSCAHNYSLPQHLPVYRFLALLQDHGVTSNTAWSWGAQTGAEFLPRIRRGRVVFSRAAWTLRSKTIRFLTSDRTSEVASKQFVEWSGSNGLPRFIVLVDGDNRLPVDCRNQCSVLDLMHLIRDRSIVTFEEMLPMPPNFCVSGPEGSFAHEIVVPVVRRPSPQGRMAETSDTEMATVSAPPHTVSLARRHPPGSSWTYAKLYCGTGLIDSLLNESVAPMVELLVSRSLVDKWFFIRFADPHPHLRLRFHSSEKCGSDVMACISQTLRSAVSSRRGWRMAFDTYQPEVERYGGAESIEVVESFFHFDSCAALRAIQFSRSDEAGKSLPRDLVVLAGVDRLFEDAGIPIADRISMLERVLNDVSPTALRMRSIEFRKRRASVTAAVASARSLDSSSPLASIFLERSTFGRTLFPQLLELRSKQRLASAFETIFFSLTHMWTNRVIQDALSVEPLVYDFLLRCYKSELAFQRFVNTSDLPIRLAE